MNPNCLNCGTAIEPGHHFCPQCGQKADTHRISLHEITHDAIHYFTHADKGIFHLIKALAAHPGKVASEYIAGKRKTYFKPLNFFLIVAGIVVFMTTTLRKEYPRPTNRSPQDRAYVKNTAQFSMAAQAGIRAGKANQFTSRYSNFITMLATPLFAGFFWLFYTRGKYRYLEHLVANMYFVPFIMLFYGLVVIPVQRFSSSYSVFMTALGLFFLFEILYRGIAYYQFMNKKGGWYLAKSIGVSLLASAVWIAVSYGLVWYYIRYGF